MSVTLARYWITFETCADSTYIPVYLCFVIVEINKMTCISEHARARKSFQTYRPTKRDLNVTAFENVRYILCQSNHHFSSDDPFVFSRGDNGLNHSSWNTCDGEFQGDRIVERVFFFSLNSPMSANHRINVELINAVFKSLTKHRSKK